jgi:hypothetical protein
LLIASIKDLHFLAFCTLAAFTVALTSAALELEAGTEDAPTAPDFALAEVDPDGTRLGAATAPDFALAELALADASGTGDAATAPDFALAAEDLLAAGFAAAARACIHRRARHGTHRLAVRTVKTKNKKVGPLFGRGCDP